MNNKSKWLNEFLSRLIAEEIIETDHLSSIGSYPLLEIVASYWGMAFNLAKANNYRFVGIWGNDLGDEIQITAGVEFLGEYLFLRTSVNTVDPRVSSITPYYLGANRLERHIRDMFGVVFIDHPDQRRWTRHSAWAEEEFPLRKNFSVSKNQGPTWPDVDYPFIKVSGAGIYEIPVGPVHAGIIEPGHFRFQVAGEDIINLEERFGYVHKGIEKIAEGRDLAGLIRLAGRVSGDSTVAHAWAACQACENGCQIQVSERALFLRAIMAERERIANHLGDIGAICNDVGFSFAYYQFTRLKEIWLRLNKLIFGHRFLMDCIVVGGVNVDLDENNKLEILRQISFLRKELEELYPILEENSGLHNRIKNTGKLTLENATKLGTLGYVGRASGYEFDLRLNAPYAPYDQLKVEVPVFNAGDVLARTRIRAQEILVSLDLLENLLSKLPSGSLKTICNITKATEGIGLIEGWRGEILTYVSTDDKGLVKRFFSRDPSWFNWPALEMLIHTEIVPDFPVCNKSINGSYSGVDL